MKFFSERTKAHSLVCRVAAHVRMHQGCSRCEPRAVTLIWAAKISISVSSSTAFRRWVALFRWRSSENASSDAQQQAGHLPLNAEIRAARRQPTS